MLSDRLEFCTSFLAGKGDRGSPVKCHGDGSLDGRMKRYSGQNQQYPDPSQPPDREQDSFNTGGSKKCKTTQSFESLFDKETLSDVTISVNDGLFVFRGHKMIIGLKSEILVTLMNDLPVSGEGTPVLYLTETDECSHVFHRFLYFIYSGSVWLHRDYVLQLHKLAQKYDVGSLVQHCENYVIQILNSSFAQTEASRDGRAFNIETICDLHEGDSMGEHVKNVAFMVLCNHAKDLIISSRWPQCEYDVVCEILRNDECHADENGLLTAATNWMKSNSLQEKSKIEGILTNIRYPLLNRRVLYHLQKNNAFKNFPPVQELVHNAIKYHCFKDLPEARNDYTGIQYTPRTTAMTHPPDAVTVTDGVASDSTDTVTQASTSPVTMTPPATSPQAVTPPEAVTSSPNQNQ